MSETVNLKIVPEIRPESAPELGTAEAAVRSCVNLISRATGQPEELLAYWLDLYYQVRRMADQPHMEGLIVPPARESRQPCSVPPPLTGEEPSGIFAQWEPVAQKKSPQAEAAAFKRDVLARLKTALAAGIKMGQLATGDLSDGEILSIRERKPMPVSVCRKLGHSLGLLDSEEKTAP